MAQDRRDSALLLLVTMVWLTTTYLLMYYAAPLLPRVIASQLSLHSFYILVLLVAAAVGIGSSALLLRAPRDDLGVRRPRLGAVLSGAVAAPVVLTLSMYLGYRLALPTLLAEIIAGGRRAAQSNTGEFGRALVETHVLTTLLWAIVLVPLVEELMFRGAMWSLLQRLTRGVGSDKPPSLPPELLSRGLGARLLPGTKRWLLSGGIATLLSAAVFGLLHADQKGGAGIVRLVQASCLGLALGMARHAFGNIWPGVVMHAGFNLMTIAKLRKWFESGVWPMVTVEIGGAEREVPLPVPTFFWKIAVGGFVGLSLWWLHRLPALRRATAEATIHIRKPRGQVFDLIVEPDTIPRTFHGHGPIPGAVSAEIISEGGMKTGAIRRVCSSDGSVMDEEIVALERPTRQAYRLTSGFKGPFKLLVREASGEWLLEREGDGTRVVWTFRFDLTSAFAYPFAAVLKGHFGRAMHKALERSRDILEAEPDSGAADG